MTQGLLFGSPAPAAAPPPATGDRWVICPDRGHGSLDAEPATAAWEAPARAMMRRLRCTVVAYIVSAGGAWQVKGRVPYAR